MTEVTKKGSSHVDIFKFGSILKLSAIMFIIELVIRIFPHIATYQLSDSARERLREKFMYELPIM